MKGRGSIALLFITAGILIGVVANTPTEKAFFEIQKETIPYSMVTSQALNQTSELNLYALSAVLMDADSGRVLYGKEADTVRPMASTTKIMTCILALETGKLDDICTISKTAAAQPKVHLGAGKGSQFYLKDLLYSLMLESHNDVAVAIAETVGGSVEQFAAMMNQKARDIGCKDTYFITPNGLDATVTLSDGTERIHGTTAEDLARIMRYCLKESPKKEEFLKITRTGNYSFTDLDGKRSFSCTNHNALLTMMNGAVSGKTGFTGGAGYSYVGALENEGRTYVIALLGSGWPPHKTYKWADAKTLFSYGAEHYNYQDVFREPTLSPILVKDGIGDTLDEEIRVSLTMNLPKEKQHLSLLIKEQERIEIHTEIKESLEAPVTAGEVVGYVKYELNGETVKLYPVYTAEAVRRRTLDYCMKVMINVFFL